MTIEKLIDEYKSRLNSINLEIKELCKINHPDDIDLCKKLNIKAKCYSKFIEDLSKINIKVDQ